MIKFYYTLAALLISSIGLAQNNPILPEQHGSTPNWNQAQYKAVGDSCGAYYNNYIGLGKTSQVFESICRQGNNSEFIFYGGAYQRFYAPQPMEISGIEFFAYVSDTDVDSVLFITTLHEYDQVNDTLGAQLAIDSVYVTHQAFSIVIPDMSVKSSFDTVVTVNSDYIIGYQNTTDDSVYVIVSDGTVNDGNGDGHFFYYYNNPFAPTYEGTYNALAFGAGYDFDALISPRIKYDLQDGFNLLDDEICPNVVSAGCVEYAQKPVFSNSQYNWDGNTSNILWTWGDGLQNGNLLNACHTYTTPGSYDITLKDTLRRYVYNNVNCPFVSSQSITVIDSVFADFSFINNDTWVIFTNNSTNADSVYWDFGDSTSSNMWEPFHAYDSVATYEVTMIAYNECFSDTLVLPVTVDNLGIEDNKVDFSLYPNPANSTVTVNGLKAGTRIELLNIIGEVVMTDVADGNKHYLNTLDYSSGTYFIRVSSDHDQVTKKLMIRH
ncbi:T9SS type A sorting domain-containing protein [Paracrocinitomix mangrovi]|uniref:T9SS type A sorting domain-containing protein n=1 Tax=Paracrocinitomix mangrovi TaxID=2862509 RepID=UPI001C8EB121|nr:T9SS type A sorting domain-containing protein [Paracrocinitomix mangrovi]UKN03530.1 T9SS type A sorting domain-containing protein [Paracrocinitomix mangrovi]